MADEKLSELDLLSGEIGDDDLIYIVSGGQSYATTGAKLKSLAAAQVGEGASYTFTAPLVNTTGTITISPATTSTPGSLSAGDKTKLDGLNAALALLAPLANPAFTGNPTVPTQTTSDDSTKAASTAFVKAAIDLVVGAAPGALDTLEEIAEKLADDDDALAAIITSVAAKLAKSANLSDLADAATAFSNIKQAATTTTSGVVELATDGESAANLAVQANDARLSNARTPTSHTHPQSEITNLTTDLAAKAPLRSTYQTYTANQTAVATDAQKTVLMNSASAVAYTVNTSVFTVGDRWGIYNLGAGQLTITPGAGVTFIGGAYKSARQGAPIWIEQVATDTFVITGDVEA